MPQDAEEVSDIQIKAFGPLEIKDEAKGSVEAVVGTINEVDSDGDVFLPGVVGQGARVNLSGYGHDVVLGHVAPAGNGTVTEENGRLILRGRFFLTTERGREAFYTTKELGQEGEWSVGFPHSSVKTMKLDEAWRAKGARRLIAGATLIETSPVLRGAQVGTGTLAVKEAVKEGVKEAEAEVAQEKAEAEAKVAAAEAAKLAADEAAEAARLETEQKAQEETDLAQDVAQQKQLQAEIDVEVERFQRTQRLFNL